MDSQAHSGSYISPKLTELAIWTNTLTKVELTLKPPKELGELMAQNMRKQRKAQKIFMRVLSVRSGVSYGSIKWFENTGEISLVSQF